jgi:hypothetical protein
VAVTYPRFGEATSWARAVPDVVALDVMRRFAPSASVAVALFFSATSALANGRFPAASAIMFDPHDSKTAYVRATFGLLVTHDGGDSWRWICEGGIGYAGQEDPMYVVTPKGTLVGSTTAGVAVSRDGGCSFAFAGGPGAHVLADIALRPDGEIVGVAAKPPHLVSSKDDAQSFSQTGGMIDPSLAVQTVEVAASDPSRLYLSATRGDGDQKTAALLVSYNSGMSWTERKIALEQGELAPYVAAVDPKEPDRVYVRTSGELDARTHLLVTDDAGKTWKSIFDAKTPLLGFALAEDGSTVYVGAQQGVSYAPTTTFAFTKGSSAEALCLGISGDRLWVCSTEKTGYFVGASRTGGRSFEAKLRIDDLQGVIDCPMVVNGVGKECEAAWPKLRAELGIPDPSEKLKQHGPAGPALRGSSGLLRRSNTLTLRGLAGIILVGMAAYYALKFIRKRMGR